MIKTKILNIGIDCTNKCLHTHIKYQIDKYYELVAISPFDFHFLHFYLLHVNSVRFSTGLLAIFTIVTLPVIHMACFFNLLVCSTVSLVAMIEFSWLLLWKLLFSTSVTAGVLLSTFE